MFSPNGSAYHLLRQVKGKYPSAHRLFTLPSGKEMMVALAKYPYDANDADYLKELNMGFSLGNTGIEATRNAILALSDALQLVGTWDWVYRLEHGLDTGVLEPQIKYLSYNLKRLLALEEEHPLQANERDLVKSISSSYIANMKPCLEYVDIDGAEIVYQTRVNAIFKYYLDIPEIFEVAD